MTATHDAIRLLLEQHWPRLREAIPLAARWGTQWFALSRPFVRWDGERAIAHVGTMMTEVVSDGRRRKVGAIHAVCVAPAFRGQGHARALLEQAMAWLADAGCDAFMLYAAEPAMYERFGFRTLVERVCELEWSSSPRSQVGHTLDIGRQRDRELVRARLGRRHPVSQAFAVTAPDELFMLDLALAHTAGVAPTLLDVPEHEALVVYSILGRALRIWDVLTPAPTALRPLLAAIPEPYAEVALEFAPDHFCDVHGERWFNRRDGDVPMVRGASLPETVAVPLLSRW